MDEKEIIDKANMNIEFYKSEITRYEQKIYLCNKFIKREYDRIRNTCTHEWTREKEHIPYGEFYTICNKCGLLKN